MQTGVTTIKFNDGRKYHIFTANSAQFKRLLSLIDNMKSQGLVFTAKNASKGIHTIKQAEQIFNQ